MNQLFTMFLVTDIRRILFIIPLLCLTFFGQAQVDDEIYNSKAKVVKKGGDKSMENGDYYGAQWYYKRFLQINDSLIAKRGLLVGYHRNQHVKYQNKLADAYRLARDYQNAEKFYLLAFTASPKKYPKAQFYLGQMQVMNGKYDKAKENFTAFKKAYRDKADAATYKKWTKLYLATCEEAPGLLQDTLDVSIYHPDEAINNAHVELSPLPLNDSVIVFSSLKSDSVVTINKNDSTSKAPKRKFYMAKQTNDSTWVSMGEFAEGWFNGDNTENGNGCFNNDSSQFFFSRGIKNQQGKLIFHLYYSDKEDGGTWSEPVKMDELINVKGYHSSQPSFGWDSKKDVPVLYFISNRIEGGRGGWDIWYTEYNTRKNSWKKPRNAGSKINTRLNEMSPKYDIENKTMHFSSDGWPGLGGLDIFKTTGQVKEWTPPQNLGFPINTSVDELYYTPTKGGEAGYFVSNRPGSISAKNATCCDDIYYFKENHYVHIGVEGKIFELVENRGVVDTIASSITLSLVLLDDSIEGGELVLKTIQPYQDGSYFLKLEKGKEYALKTGGDTVFNQTFNVNTEGIVESDTLGKDFFLKKFSLQPIVVKNIYYEYNKSELLDSSKMVLDTTMYVLLLENPDIIVEIGSHTDSKGGDVYNQKLSQDRAQSVVNYLVSKGMTKKRLVAKGYGEKQPIAPNKNPDGTDNPEGRQLNRRTEFRVVGKIQGVSEIIYTK